MKFNKITNDFLNETVYEGVHESGLRVCFLEKKKFNKFYGVIATKYGSNDISFINENNECITVPDGIAHFLEHKMFEQPDGSDAFNKFAEYGANANAFTSFNHTAYLFQSTSKFYENLSHLLSFVFTPHFTKENVLKEQGIIGQEIRMYDDDPDWRVMFNMLRCMYEEHPVRRDIAGTVESISEIDKELLYTCYNAFYNPNNMVLFIAGNIDLSRIPEILDNYVPNKGKFLIKHKIYNDNAPVKVNEITDKLDVSIPLFSFGFKDASSPVKGTELLKRNFITTVITKVLLGESSSLYKKMYEEGLINDSFGDDITMNRDYAFVQFAGESKNPEKFKKLILEEIKRIKKEKLDEKAFERVKKNLYGSYIKSFDSIENVGNSFCANYFLDVGLFDFVNMYDSISIDEANERFNELFNENYFVSSVIMPSK